MKKQTVALIQIKINLLRLNSLLNCRLLFWTICFIKQSLVNISPDLVSDFTGPFKLESLEVTQRSTLKLLKYSDYNRN